MKYSDTTLSEKPFDMREGDGQPKGSRYCWRLMANAARRMGVELQQSEVDMLYYYNYLGVVIDEPIDRERLNDNERSKLIKSVFLNGDMSLVPNADQTLLGKSLDYMASLPAATREEFTTGVITAMSSDPAKRSATTLYGLVNARLAEAERYAEMLKLEDTEFYPDGANRKQFNYWLKVLSQVGYLVDTLFDLEDDYNRGEIILPPESRYKVALARLGVVKSVDFVRTTPARSYPDVAYYLRKYSQ